VLTADRREDDRPPRLGLVATKKFGPAVVRNRAKRRAREAFRRQSSNIKRGLDLVILFRSAAADSDCQAFNRSFSDILAEACLLEES
jgi:ribonuclease P protein component